MYIISMNEKNKSWGEKYRRVGDIIKTIHDNIQYLKFINQLSKR